MGNNTTVLVLNDYLGDIEKDPQMGKLLALAVKMHRNGEKNPVGSGVIVVESHHADNTAIIAVGGNTARTLAYVLNSNPTDADIVGAVMEKTGYKPPKLSRLEMNEFLKKEYGCRMITLVKKAKPVTRKKVAG